MKFDQPSLLALLVAEKRPEFPDEPERTRIYRFVPAAAVALVVVVLLVGIALRDDGSQDGGPDMVAAAAVTTTTTTTLPASTIAVVPTTTAPPPPPDDIKVCQARDKFVLAASTLDPSQVQDKASVTLGLQVMSTALQGLRGATGHPDLVGSVEVVRSVVDYALVEITSAGSEDLVTLADNPRFTDPALGAAIGTIRSYPLRCPAPG